MNLTAKQRHMLRALAHPLDPVVQIGHAGLTEPVVLQIDEALRVHELIKIKLGKECPIAIEDAAAQIEQQTRSSLIQSLGRVVTVFRRNQTKPKLILSSKEKAAAERTARSKLSGRQLIGSAKRKRAASGPARNSKKKRPASRSSKKPRGRAR
jgi:RNA-binding protein